MNTPQNLGWTGTLCILPFDHRSFFEELLGFSEPLTDQQTAQLTEYKKIVYAGYEKSLSMGIPSASSAILVDDVQGMEILLDAKSKHYNVLQTTEKSGDNHFEFQHDDWQAWIEKVKPTFAKALVRYNPDADKNLNEQSLQGLKQLSDYAHEHGYKFLIEPLVPATDEQLASVSSDKGRYDRELRPALCARMITEMQNAGVEPDVWKVEGFYAAKDYELVVAAAKAGQAEGLPRTDVGVISLGRNETDEVVSLWLTEGAKVPGVIGFAVGRTVFLSAVMKYKSGEFSKEQAELEIANRFVHFYTVFTGK
jgi:myo-inositol catabolism protein IolC